MRLHSFPTRRSSDLQLEDLLPHFGADVDRLGIGILFELPNVIRGFSLLADFDFNELGRAALEYAAISDSRASGLRARCGGDKPSASNEAQQSQQ